MTLGFSDFQDKKFYLIFLIGIIDEQMALKIVKHYKYVFKLTISTSIYLLSF